MKLMLLTDIMKTFINKIIMKKITIVVAMLVASVVANAQNVKAEKDTILVTSKSIRFDKESYESKTGKFRTDYLVLIDGEWYFTNKTSYDRYYACLRFGGKPNVFFVKPKESKVKTAPKVIVL